MASTNRVFLKRIRPLRARLLFFGESYAKSSDRSEVFQAVCVTKLLEKLRIQKYYVVGTSYGGLVAYHMAARPKRVEKVVIASSWVNFRRTDNDELLKRAKFEKIEELMLPATAGNGILILRRRSLELLKGLSLGRDDSVNISPLQQEVLVVWGEQDEIFLLEKAHELKELQGEKARLEVIKNTSHLPQLEYSAKFNNVVKNFLCELS